MINFSSGGHKLPAKYTLGVLGMVAFGTLIRFHFLSPHSDTILSQGRQISTAEFDYGGSNFIYGVAALNLLCGLVAILRLNGMQRYAIAQLSWWQRWLIWPFPSMLAPGITKRPPSPPLPKA